MIANIISVVIFLYAACIICVPSLSIFSFCLTLLLTILLCVDINNLHSVLRRYRLFPIAIAILSTILATEFLNLGMDCVKIATKAMYFIVSTYLSLLTGLLVARKKRIFAIKCVVICSLFCALYGGLCVMINNNPIENFIAANFNVASQFDIYARGERGVRANGVAMHPIYFGYEMLMLALYMFFEFKTFFLGRLTPLIFILAAFLSNSRTPIIAVVFGLFVAFVKEMNVKKVAMIFAVVVSCLFFVNMFSNARIVRYAMETIETGGANSDGSSIGLRFMQFTSIMKIVNDSPVWGHGLDYVREGLGWDGTESRVANAAGFESIIFSYLLEIGWVGLLLYFGFIVFLLRTAHRLSVYVTPITLVIMFITFSVVTGPLSSWPSSMLLFSLSITKKNDRTIE